MLSYRDISFLSEEKRQAFRRPLIKLFEQEEPFVYYQESEDYAPSKKYLIKRGWEVGLLDVDMNGVPELIVNLGGGSAGNAFYEVYDLGTGKLLGEISGSYEDSLCTYFDMEKEVFVLLVQYQTQMGWASRFSNVDIVSPVSDDRENEAPFRQDSCFEVNYEVIDEFGMSDGWRASFYIEEKEVSLDDYLSEHAAFFKNYIRIPETDMILLDRSAYDTPEEMADALLSTQQQFIAFSEQ